MPQLPSYAVTKTASWEMISTPYLINSMTPDFMFTFRRPFYRRVLADDLRSDSPFPAETIEYVYLLIEGTSIPKLEAFATKLMKLIDAKIVMKESFTRLHVDLPDYVSHYLISGSNAHCQ